MEYVSKSELMSSLNVDYSQADGKIIVILCENEEERNTALNIAKSGAFRSWPNVLVAIPKPLSGLKELIKELQRWEWVIDNVPELNHDPFATEEVTRQISSTHRSLHKRIKEITGLTNYMETAEIQWYRLCQLQDLSNSRKLLTFLSSICDKIYNRAPHIQNELVNRRVLSSAASGARMRLIERIFKNSSEPLLGMDPLKKPPEMSMYLSVIQASQLHQIKQGELCIAEPDVRNDPCSIRPTLLRIKEVLSDKTNSRVTISDLFKELKKPPYGIREGLQPLFLAIFTIIHENEIAFYEDDYFLRHVSTEHFYRIIKAPETFEMQWCNIESFHNILFEELLKILGENKCQNNETNILKVAIPLMNFAASLPLYTHNTKNLSSQAKEVRNVLREAKEPVDLIFVRLPKSCGFSPFSDNSNIEDIQNFVVTLKNAMDELSAAYPELLDLIKTEIVKEFDLPHSIQKHRETLANDAKKLLVTVTETKLKAFCLRLVDDKLNENQWLESLGSYICSKPPLKWADSDVELFRIELQNLANQFKRVQSLVFTKVGTSNATAIRLAVTRQDGSEISKVAFINPEEEILADAIEGTISEIIHRSKRIGLVAASRAIWTELNERKIESNSSIE